MDIDREIKDAATYTARRISDMPRHFRPREMFERYGAKQVPDEVLLAILIRTGSAGMNALDLARQMLLEYTSLTALARAPASELAGNSRFKGMGPAKAQLLKAALELARRLANENMIEPPSISSPGDAAAILREEARILDHEVFWVLLLDTKNKLMGMPREISRGVLDASLVHPREVFRGAIQTGAAALIALHNHPSGDPSPSAEDVRITRQLVETGRLVDIPMLDHIVLGQRRNGSNQDFVSLRESGLVDFKRN